MGQLGEATELDGVVDARSGYIIKLVGVATEVARNVALGGSMYLFLSGSVE